VTRRQTLAALGLALGSAWLAGCASVAPGPAEHLSGRLALRVAATDQQAERGFNASFELRGGAERGELRLSTVLGPQIASARWTPGEARLTSSDGERLFAGLDELSREVLGESLPLQALPDWLRGRPWPATPARQDGSTFEQLGWHVDLARLAEGFVTATRAAAGTAPAVSLRVRLETP